MSEAPPARIHLLTARGAPYVAVIRRKPNWLYHVLRWNTETDEVEQGSWFDWRIYETHSDISFDGQWMVYLARGARNTNWTGLCKLPRLTTLFDIENVSTYGGGGVFAGQHRLELNLASFMDGPSAVFRAAAADLPFQVRLMQDEESSYVGPVMSRRFDRDGYKRIFRVEDGDDRIVPTWEVSPTDAHPLLRVRYLWDAKEKELNWKFDLPDLPGFLDSQVTWAAYDFLGQLVVARRGTVARYTLTDIERWQPSRLIDLEPLKPGSRYVKEDKPPVDEERVKVVQGRLEDQDVQILVLPIVKADWTDRVRDLAGDQAQPTGMPEVGQYVLGGACYLRQHYLLHTHEPARSTSKAVLDSYCSAVFAGTGLHSHTATIALRPIGIASGWPLAKAYLATRKAALEFVDGYPKRRVLIVANDDEEFRLFIDLAEGKP